MILYSASTAIVIKELSNINKVCYNAESIAGFHKILSAEVVPSQQAPVSLLSHLFGICLYRTAALWHVARRLAGGKTDNEMRTLASGWL